MNLSRRAVAEALGTALLLAAVVGSGRDGRSKRPHGHSRDEIGANGFLCQSPGTGDAGDEQCKLRSFGRSERARTVQPPGYNTQLRVRLRQGCHDGRMGWQRPQHAFPLDPLAGK